MQKVIRFQPIYKHKLWGGRNLEKLYNRVLPEKHIGESWEVSDYHEDISIITNGELSGKNFREIHEKYREEVLGDCFSEDEPFPLLIKFIDASEHLSVQVHPDDYYALYYDQENSGKKEAWLILQSEQDAGIVCGFIENMNREAYKALVLENRAEDCLQKYKVKPGDAYIINPGTVHAIGEGIFLLEIQQSSDSTYRVYDFGRVDDDGKPRKLHLEKALDVIDFNKSNNKELLQPEFIPWSSGTRLKIVANDKFRMDTLEFNNQAMLPPLAIDNVFHIVVVIEGNGSIENENFSFQGGDTFLITARGMKEKVTITPGEKLKIALMSVGTDWIRFK
ncbi:MAG: class I mannose-6-phosphate isomerase [Leptospiraceae bacterium]|nr:class I mannose-6-phosphate isomerase [Leptospiraceae bacterium]MCP5497181.1 class I mannose-6-phosphate isomerase [Leptospiraceae bacterium]